MLFAPARIEMYARHSFIIQREVHTYTVTSDLNHTSHYKVKLNKTTKRNQKSTFINAVTKKSVHTQLVVRGVPREKSV